tara:strand:- start:1874 stop:2083 length:210 start_codon:yes stop_codon:yes gene_type:complete
MDIIKGSQEYIDYINEYIVPDYRIEDYILTLEEDVIIDMLDSGEYITYDDAYVSASMESNGDTLILPED